MSMRTPMMIGSVWLVLVASLPTETLTQEREPDLLDRLASFEMRRVRPDAQAVADRIASAAEVMLQRPVDREGVRASLAPAVSGSEIGNWTRFAPAPQLLVRYDPEFDEIRLLNEELSSREEDLGELDEQRVLQLTGSYIRDLGARGVLSAAMYDVGDAEIGYRRVGAGRFDGVRAYDRVVEFRVTLRPKINGIEVANAGVQLGLLPTGELVSLRVGGVSFPVQEDNTFLEPEGEGRIFQQRVSTDAIKARFYRSLPQGVAADVMWERVMYVMPEGEERAVVEPLYVISYSEIREVDGQPVISRRKTVGYSLVDPDAEPVDFTPVSKSDIEQGQRPERKAVEE